MDDSYCAPESDLESDLSTSPLEAHHESTLSMLASSKAQFAEEPSYFIRPNRFFGSETSYLSYIEKERALVAGMETENAKDLSRHLYNAYALRKRAKEDLSGTDGRQAAGNGTDEEVEDGEQNLDNKNESFKPPRSWTAWPLPSGKVPREKFLPSTGPQAIRAPEDTRSSAALEECLIAAATRFAKEKWEAREWEERTDEQNEGSASGESVPDQQHEEDSVSGESVSDHPDESMEDVSAEDASTHTVETGSDTEMAYSDTSDIQPPQQAVAMFSSRAFMQSDSESESESESESDSFIDSSASQDYLGEPIFSADDARTRELLLPSTRHIISKLDDILIAARKVRQGQIDDTLASIKRRLRKRAAGMSEEEINAPTDSEEEDESEDELENESEDEAEDESGDESGDEDMVSEEEDEPQDEPEDEPKDEPGNEGEDEDMVSEEDDEPEDEPENDGEDEAEDESGDESEDEDMTSKDDYEEDTADMDSEACEEVINRGRSSAHPQVLPSRQEVARALKPLDWTSIIGLAAATQAFDPEVIARARDRCAKLFDESQPGTPQGSQESSPADTSDVQCLPKPSNTTADAAFYCHIENCPRSKDMGGKPFFPRSNLFKHWRNKHPELDVKSAQEKLIADRGEHRGKYSRA